MTAGKADRYRWFPPPPLPDVPPELRQPNARIGPVLCTVCGQRAMVQSFMDNPREWGMCAACGAVNRARQLALVLTAVLGELAGCELTSLADAERIDRLLVYNVEAAGPVHRQLQRMPNYLFSEYFGPEHRSGELVNGIVHQDLQDLSFPDGVIDVVVTSEVLEHVPDPYRAHAEIHRVLRPGGRHVFTVPYMQASPLDEVRTTMAADGSLTYHHPAIYHGDPLRPEGALVFTHFGLEMLAHLAMLGFEPRVYRPHAPEHGILGANALVFEAVKTGEPITSRPGRRPPLAREHADPAVTPRLSVVLPVRDDAAATTRSLVSVGGLELDGTVELVVVDNASRDGTPKLLAALEGDVRIVRNRHDQGFAAACRQGAEAARGETLLLLAQGTEVDGEALGRALADLEAGATPSARRLPNSGGTDEAPRALLVRRAALLAMPRPPAGPANTDEPRTSPADELAALERALAGTAGPRRATASPATRSDGADT